MEVIDIAFIDVVSNFAQTSSAKNLYTIGTKYIEK